MFDERLVISLVYAPDPGPSVVLLFPVVGPGEVDQQTPRTMTADPPSLVMVPPPAAEIEVIDVTAIVERVGSIAVVVKFISLPYEVPALLVA